MHGYKLEMGESFTGVKNQKLTRMAAVLFAVITVAAAAEMALVEPKDAAASIGAKGPAVICVGPNVLFRSKHVPGSVYAGPGSSAAGLEMLRAAAGKLTRDREILIYCGCCPWDRCPNVKPAVAVLQEMGFTKVKALHLETGFKVDWIDKGYAVEGQ
jgi:thiosulfate/3-mercaptopyruvate sulfurtransferase